MWEDMEMQLFFLTATYLLFRNMHEPVAYLTILLLVSI